MNETKWIAHHGILGQKWGVRNSATYPLSYDEHSAAQKKLNPKSSLDNYGGSNQKTTAPKHRTVGYNTYGSQRKNNNKTSLFDNIGKIVDDAKSGLGITARENWQKAQSKYDTHEQSYASSPAATAQGYIDELNSRTYDQVSELDKEHAMYYQSFVDYFNEEGKELKNLAKSTLKEYESTPLGKIEATFNDVVEPGKKWVENAISDVGAFFKKIF